MHEKTIKFIREIYQTEGLIPLHEPLFIGNEKKYVSSCIDSTFVSSVGEFVGRFEEEIAEYTGAKYAVATMNGTSALHTALHLAGVSQGDEVITQALTFVATCNAILYTGAKPIFIDVEKSSMGLCPIKLEEFLFENTEIRNDKCYNKKTGAIIKVVLPMHTFGMPAKINEILRICNLYRILLIEDAAESLGSYNGAFHTGTQGYMGVLSFNGNKIITSGGGGMLLINEAKDAERAKHLTTTAKIPHKWEYIHDQMGFNYRLPNLNAALGLAQLENLNDFLEKKRSLAQTYNEFFSEEGISFMLEPHDTRSNYWLNTILLADRSERNLFLEGTNSQGIMTRPVWRLMIRLPMYKNMQASDLSNSRWLEDRIVNIPSSVIN